MGNPAGLRLTNILSRPEDGSFGKQTARCGGGSARALTDCEANLKSKQSNKIFNRYLGITNQ
jgi:hypothetical protein